MGVFKPPVGTTTPLSNNALALNGKSEDQLSVATATNADKLDNLDASDFATTGDIPTDYGDVIGPEGATAGNFPILDVTGKILSDSNYAPSDFATYDHTHDYGDVYSKSLSVENNIVTFNDNTGKNIKDSGYKLDDFATYDHTHDYVKTDDYTDTDILNKIKNVDGYGSGLDTDLWQGFTPQNITIDNAFNATTLDNEYAYVYRNVVNIKGIFNAPPSNLYTGIIIMVGSSPSGGFEGVVPGTVLKYDENSANPNWKWIAIGNIYWR